MKTMKLLKTSFFLLALCALSCENPFKAGLGPVIDLTGPTINLVSPAPASYIFGTTTFWGYAEDDYKVDSVWFKINEQTEVDYLKEYTNVSSIGDVRMDGRKLRWEVKINTKLFGDGNFKIQFKAIDSYGKEIEPNEVLFTIKNDGPQINVDTPSISEKSRENPALQYGTLGSDHLNFFTPGGGGEGDFPTGNIIVREIDNKGMISGSLIDREGIAGVASGVNSPQYRMWKVYDGVVMPEPGPHSGVTYSYTQVPSESQVPWKNIKTAEYDGLQPMNASGTDGSPTNCGFNIRGPDDPGGFWAFQIRIWSVDAQSRTYRFPQDGWTQEEGGEWDLLTPAQKIENIYALVYINMETDSPDAGLLNLQNIYGAFTAGRYPALTVPGSSPAVDLTDNYPHPYVSGVNVSKNGAFTLRVWAEHNAGISSAEVYWKKVGTTDRGRFIWDTATTAAPNLTTVPITSAYNTWGYGDRTLTSRRYFIFTYNDYKDNTTDVIPAGAAAPLGTPTTPTTTSNGTLPARPKVQQFTGTDINWNLRANMNFSVDPTGTPVGTWSAYSMEAGTYELEIYVRSTKGSVITAPYTCSITLDKTAPTVELNTITETYLESTTAPETNLSPPAGTSPWATVNGVISAKMIFTENESGLRNAAGANSSYYSGPEQRYVLVTQGNKAAWETAANSFANNWPDEVAAAATSINGVPVARHGSFSSSAALIKTSKIYAADTAVGGVALPDGDYWLYVYARDNAFNVGKLALPIQIIVKAATDTPRFDFSVGGIIPDVTKPNETGSDENGFLYNGTIRNKLARSSDIEVLLKDDDGLNVGLTSGSTTGITVSITTHSDPDNAAYKVSLTPDEVRKIFAPASGQLKESRGKITQAILLEKLKANTNYNALFPNNDPAKWTVSYLPDGMYQITIRIEDRQADKLTMSVTNPPVRDADVAYKEVSFWVVADYEPPEMETDPATTESGGYVPGAAEVKILGTVSDANGPITMTWTVTKGTGEPVTQTPVVLTKDNSETTKWKSNLFTINKALSDLGTPVTGSYKFELIFTDRFGMSTTKTWTYNADSAPPTWDFTAPMAKNENATTGNIIPATIPADGIGDWWVDATGAKTAAKRTWLIGRSIPVISYTPGSDKPVLRGTFTDAASNIDTATFKYRIDGGAEQFGTIETIGKSVRWFINLTDNGLASGNPLGDGVHTVQLTVKDTTQNELPWTAMYAFRIDSKQPEVAITSITPSAANGTAPGNQIVISGTASDANLNTVTLSYRIGSGTATTVDLNAATLPAGVTRTLTYEYGATTPPPAQPPQPPQPPAKEILTWTYTITVNTANSPANGTYDVTVTATDFSGKSPTEAATGSFIIDRTLPTIAFEGLVSTATGTANTLTPATIVISGTGVNGNVINSATVPVRGTVTETGSGIASMQTRIERWNWGLDGSNNTVPAAWEVYTGEDWKTLSPSENWIKTLSDIANFADGLYRMQVRAVDGAGNTGTSNYMYFYRDTTSVGLTPDQLNSYYSLTATGTLTFTGSANSLNRFRSVTAKVDLGTNTRPTGWPNASAWPPEGTWTPNPLTTGAAAQNWTINVTVPNSIAYDGTRSVTFKAVNMAGREQEVSLPLNLDSTPPTLAITTPALRSPAVAGRPNASIDLNGGVDEILAGTSQDPGDNASGLTGLWYRIGLSGGAVPTEAQLKAELDAYTITTDATPKPINPADYTAKAKEAAKANGNLWFELGGTKPDGFVISSSNMHDWRITVPKTLNAVDLNGLTQFARTITLKGTSYNTGLDYSGNKLTTATNNTKYVSLPLWVFSTDRAGNTKYVLREIWFDPDAATPRITITTPEENTTGGGSIIAQGTAKSVSSIYAVVYRVTSGGNISGNQNFAVEPVTISGARPLTDGGRSGVEAKLKAALSLTDADLAYWYLATNEAGWGQNDIPFNFVVNGNDEISRRINAQGSTATTIQVKLEVYAFSGTNAPDLPPGDGIETRTFFIKNTSPSITNLNLSHTGGTANGDFVLMTDTNRAMGGTFAVRAALNAGQGQALSKIEIRRSAEDNIWYTVWPTTLPEYNAANTPGISVTPSGATQNHTIIFRLNSLAGTVTANTPANPSPTTIGYNTVKGGAWEKSGGKYPIEIRITDNAALKGTATATFNLGIDNFAPVADTWVGANTPNKRAGSAEEFYGRVFDYMVDTTSSPVVQETPTERGIKQIDVWFTRMHHATQTGWYINPDTGAEAALTGAQLYNVPDVYKERKATVAYNGGDSKGDVTKIAFASSTAEGYNDGTVPAPAAVNTATAPPTGATAAYVKRITATTGAPGAGTGLRWTATTAEAYDVSWTVTLDTNKIADGWIQVHYLVEDKMGNKSYYTQETIIRNRAPQINAVTLYTDNRGVGAQFTTSSTDTSSERYVIDRYRNHMDKGYLNTGFIVKNDTLVFGVETLRGNNELNFQVQYATRSTVTLNSAGIASMIADKNAGRINVYTIASQGTYTATDWAKLGLIYTGDGNPPNGTHFIFNGVNIFEGGAIDKTATVWKYTLVGASPNELQRSVLKRSLNNPNVIPKTENGVTVDDTLKFITGSYGNALIRERKNSIPEFGSPNYDSANTGTHYEPESPPAGATAAGVFLVRVWDKVDTTKADSELNEQLHDTVVIDMNVYRSDTVNPTATVYDLNPATETAVSTNMNTTIANALNPRGIGLNEPRGGLYNASGSNNVLRRSGHIEPRTNSSFNVTGNTYSVTQDEVSGAVILRGKAWDDQLIRSVSLTIGATNIPLLSLNNTTKMLEPASASVSKAEKMDWRDGHTVEWAYLWNTETNYLTPTTNAVTITVTVNDDKGAPNTNAADTVGRSYPSSETETANKGVIIKPFVYGFTRDAGNTPPRYASTRSRQGWYSFFQGEDYIAILGYNLGTTGTTANTSVTIYDGEDTSGNLVRTTPYITVGGASRPVFTVGASQKSGRIDLSVNGGIAAINNAVDVTQAWNKDYHRFTPGSDIWDSKLYAHIWRTNQEVGTASVGGTFFGSSTTDTASMQNPAMTLEYGATDTNAVPGRLHGVWGVKSTFGVYYGTNNGNITGTARGRNRLQDANDPLLLPDIDYFPGTTNANNRTAIAVYEWDGLPGMILTTTMEERPVYTGGDIIRPSIFVTTRSTTVSSSDRWQNPRVRMAAANNNATTGSGMAENAPRGDAGRLYVSTYDSVNKSLHFVMRAGTANSPNTTERNTPTGLVIDGTGADTAVRNNNTWGNITTNLNNPPAAGSSSATRAGMWSAVDYIGTGANIRPVIAYYDETNDTLRLAYSSTLASNAGTDWTRRNVLNTTDPLFRGSGKYVSMKVDKNGHIHLAFYNSTYQAMVYASTSGGVTGNFTAYIVDNVVTGGVWTDIAVDNTGNASIPANAWIVYGNTGRIGNYDGVRIAYSDPAFTKECTDQESGKAITGWEALSMPAAYTITDDRLNIECWPPADRRATPVALPVDPNTGGSPNGGWHAAVGYSGTDRNTNTRMFRIGYFFKPGVKPGD